MKSQSRQLRAARFYSRSWDVLPIYEIISRKCACGAEDCQSPGKHPRTISGVKNATRNRQQIEEWWAQWPEANVGIATGTGSGILVADFDPRNGGEGSLKKVLNGEPLPKVPTVDTGGAYICILTSPPVEKLKVEVALCPAWISGATEGTSLRPHHRIRAGSPIGGGYQLKIQI
jgi:Bifunctional DNA primase/polymerase, N-terminal